MSLTPARSLEQLQQITEIMCQYPKKVTEIIQIGTVVKLSLDDGAFILIDDDGQTRWFNQQGLLHREDGPAIKLDCAYQEWWLNNVSTYSEVYLDGMWHQRAPLKISQ
jgi:hypothetical protein